MTQAPSSPDTGLLAELRRRGVVRAVAAYALFAFAALQVSEPLLHALKLPDSWLTGLVVLLGLGFPLTAALSWAFDLTRQGIVRTDAAPAADGAPSRGRLGQAVVVLAAAGLGALLAWLALRPPATPVDADGRVSVAVADFANQTGEPALDALSGLLITSLEQSKKLKVLTRGRMLELLRQAGEPRVERIDEALARLVGGKAGVKALLLASIQKLGGSYVVELRALDTQKDHYLFTLREQAGDQAGILPLIDRLSEQTRLRLRERDAEVQGADIQVAEAVTPNLEAYRHYFKGKELRARLDDLGADREFRRALELQPGFALAQLEISLVASVWLLPDQKLYREAARRASRLPVKEREILLAWSDLEEGHSIQAAERARRLAERYPLDSEVLLVAASAAPEAAEKVALYRRVLALVPDHALARVRYALFAIQLGMAKEALDEALAEERARPTGAAATAVGIARLGTGDPTAALADFQRALRAEPMILWAQVGESFALALADDFPGVRALAERAPFNRRSAVLALLDLRQGRQRAAARRLEEVAAADGPSGEEWLSLSKVIRAAGVDRSAALIPAWAPAKVHRAAALREAGDLDGAVKALGPIDPRECGLEAWLLGTLESERGHHAEALELLRRFEPCHLIGFRGEARLLWLDDAQVRIARGLAATGRSGEGRQVLARFLARWKEAEQDLPLLAEARALCRELKCQAP